jgi:hypothetical protein
VLGREKMDEEGKGKMLLEVGGYPDESSVCLAIYAYETEDVT